MLEITTWVFIVIVQVAIAASIGVAVLYAKLRSYQRTHDTSHVATEEEIARTKIRVQSANQLKDMYFSLKAKYTALVKAQSEFEENVSRIVNRDEQAKLAEYFSAVNSEKEQVARELTIIEKSLLSIAVCKDSDDKATNRKAFLVQETSEYIDSSVGKIQALLHQQKQVMTSLTPFVMQLPDEMEVKKMLLDNIRQLQKTTEEMDAAMQSVCEQNRLLQNQVVTILGENELAMRDLRKQLDSLNKALAESKKAYDELNQKYQQTEEEFQHLHIHSSPKHAS